MNIEKRIAVLSRARYSYHRQLGMGFLEGLDLFTGHIDDWEPIMFFSREAHRDIMRERVKDVIAQGHDLILPIGALWSEIAIEYVREYNVKTPVLFSGVTDPVALKMLPTLAPDHQVTGVVMEQFSWVRVAAMLLKIKPHMKRVIIPYYRHAENGLVEERLKEVQAYYATKEVDCILYAVDIVRSYPQEMHDFMLKSDVIWSFEGGFLDVYSKDLIEMCNDHSITFFSNNAAHLAQGAALVFAIPDFTAIGQALVLQAYQLLEKGKRPDQVPIITLPNERRMMINPVACKQQGIEVDEKLLVAIRAGMFTI